MRKQLELLTRIQKIDTDVKTTDRLKAKFEKDIQGLKEEVERDEERHNNELSQLEKLEKEYKDKEKAIVLLQEKIAKTEEKMRVIKTNKEYQASMQEIENIKKMISDKEEEMLVTMDAVEAVKKELKSSEDELGRCKAEFEEKKREIEVDLKKFLDEVEKEKETRESLVGKIDKDLYERYKQVQALRNGVAVAFAEAEQCLGCSMKIPPQLYNEAAHAAKMVSCPNCQRILVIKPLDKNETDDA